MFFYSCTSETKESSQRIVPLARRVPSNSEEHPGKMIYMQFCLACHMENGEGVPQLYPPIGTNGTGFRR